MRPVCTLAIWQDRGSQGQEAWLSLNTDPKAHEPWRLETPLADNMLPLDTPRNTLNTQRPRGHPGHPPLTTFLPPPPHTHHADGARLARWARGGYREMRARHSGVGRRLGMTSPVAPELGRQPINQPPPPGCRVTQQGSNAPADGEGQRKTTEVRREGAKARRGGYFQGLLAHAGTPGRCLDGPPSDSSPFIRPDISMRKPRLYRGCVMSLADSIRRYERDASNSQGVVVRRCGESGH
ncbi:hypothetical protein DPEC_G00291560 [Dallia pectoralis]|uniref:Uncharacterized protein n=1 Tax=Dallia pectoralis TaxID=75939 RepID=A0ACC2FHV3_DALPE|nr:hypothetical protein DPEC_G00291560 [Dallia pectoralis]